MRVVSTHVRSPRERAVRRPRPAARARVHWIVSVGLLALAGAMTVWYVPLNPATGVIHKITFIHLAVAINTLVALGTVFFASAAYLWQRTLRWDALADAAVRVSVLLCSIILLTGMVWAKTAWGRWWEWSPSMTFSLVLWLLYVGYVIVRKRIRAADRRATICAVYAIIAFFDVPLVYLSVKLLPDQHPSSFSPDARTALTLGVWLFGVAMFTAGLIAARARLTRVTSDTIGVSEGDRSTP